MQFTQRETSHDVIFSLTNPEGPFGLSGVPEHRPVSVGKAGLCVASAQKALNSFARNFTKSVALMESAKVRLYYSYNQTAPARAG